MFDNVTRTRHVLDLHEKEQKARDEATFSPDGAADRLNPLQQMGRTLEPGLFMAKLRLCNPNFIFEVPRPGFMAILIEKDGFNIKTGALGRRKVFIVSFGTTGPLPEFSVMAPRIEEKPTKEGQLQKSIKHAYEKTRGWRTVLAKLLVAGVITETHITKHFTPELGRSSELWQKHVHPSITVGGQNG